VPRTIRGPRTLVAACLLAGLGATVPAAPAAAATTVTVAASDDTYVSSRTPDRNFGTATALYASRTPGDKRTAYLKFTVRGIPAGATGIQATLTLSRDGAAQPPATQLYAVSDRAWTEGRITHRTAPALGARVGTAAGAPYTFDVTGQVRGNGVYAFAAVAPSTRAAARFRSGEATSRRPALTIRYTAPAASPAPAQPAPGCTVSPLLVPSCGAWWGAAPGAMTSTPRDAALATYERKTGRKADIMHLYKAGNQLFPTETERKLALEPGRQRLLSINWKPSGTWADIAAGKADAQIDAEARYLRATWSHKFFLTIHHEPENDVVTTAGSGMTAKDYRAMFRHTALRLKAGGVGNAVLVMNYMGFQEWATQPWFGDLYPGDDVVDWIAYDPYLSADNGKGNGYATLVNRTTNAKVWPGFYRWATTKHPGKPLMLAEWGIFESTKGNTSVKPAFFADMARTMGDFPAIKALLYFDAPKAPRGDTRIDSTSASLDAFTALGRHPKLQPGVPSYR
jgi:hypothetical protein